MDTNRIRYFISLARTGSISKAAELHHISAAAFSKSMKVFESETGQTLTLRHGRGVILTDYAKSLVPRLEDIIKKIDSVHDGLKSPSTEHKTLRIATFEVFSTHFMTRAVQETFSDYNCEIHEMIPGKMEEAVAAGKVDLALTYLPIPHAHLDFLKVVEIEMGIFGNLRLMKSKDYSSASFVAPINPVEGAPTKVNGLDGWPDQTFPRKVKFHVDMLETALGLCRKGLAIAYLPKFIVHLHNETVKPDLCLDPLSKPKGFPKGRDYVYLIKRKSDEEGATAKKMAQAIRKICR